MMGGSQMVINYLKQKLDLLMSNDEDKSIPHYESTIEIFICYFSYHKTIVSFPEFDGNGNEKNIIITVLLVTLIELLLLR